MRISDKLNEAFGVSIDKARSWLMITDSREYTKALNKFVDGGEDVYDDNADSTTGAIGGPNAVIDGEESEIINNVSGASVSDENDDLDESTDFLDDESLLENEGFELLDEEADSIL